MSPDKEEAPHPRIDISACLDAVKMYDAAYHQERSGLLRERAVSITVYQEPEPSEPLKLVSLWEYVWATGLKTGAGLLGQALFVTTLVAGILIIMLFVGNVVHDLSTTEKKPYTFAEITPAVPKEDNYSWAEERHIYGILFTVMLLSPIGSAVCLRRAERIKPMLPIQYADTAHLPAEESLVRASSPPPASAGELLRSAGQVQETPPEQLLRATTGTEQSGQE